MKQEPNSRGLGIPRLQAGEQVKVLNDTPAIQNVLSGIQSFRLMRLPQ